MEKKLSKGAYGGVSGKDYVPYVTDKSQTGGNVVIIILGLVMATIFAASTAYSGMKSGMTVAAGIPGSIIGGALVTLLAKNKGILGRNLIQGMSSGGESIAGGITFVLPAVLLIGAKVDFFTGVLIGLGGVLLGIAFSALVHNYLIVEEHGKLMYPEAMAISETLVASEGASDSLKYMGIGFGIGGAIQTVTSSVFGWLNNSIDYVGQKTYKYLFGISVDPMLFGIGFIVGWETSVMMFAGSIIASMGITPLIGYFVDMAGPNVHLWNDPNTLVQGLGAGAIRGAYVKYIGAGMMLCGGIIGAIKLIPVIATSIKETLGAKSSSESDSGSGFQKVLLIAGIVVTFVSAFFISGNVTMAIVAAIVSVIFILLFSIVSGRLTGTVGTSNLPVSGMTIASLVILTLVFVVMGWKDTDSNTSLLLFGSLIVTAIATAGGYMQSQKVTYIIGGRKGEMQKYFTASAVVGVVVVTGVIVLLKDQLIDPNKFAIPQANLMAVLTKGIMQGNLPWVMIFTGIAFGLLLFFLNIPIMTVAVGFYLPINISTIVLIGALIRVLVEKMNKAAKIREGKVANGISLSSGLVAGGSILGLLGIILQTTNAIKLPTLSGFAAGNGAGFVLLAVLVILTAIFVLNSKVKKE
ncbi:MAG: putative oligopeptide transporter [Firmicutes bacterium]|nr:putative oligopeptide transporter [Bacillota bacterium]